MSSVCKIDNRFAEKNGRLLVGLETITPIIIAQYYKTDIDSKPATNGFTVSNLSSNQPNLVYYSKDYNTNPYMIDVSAAQFIPKSALTAVETLDGGFRVAVDDSGRKYCLDGNLANVDGAYYIPDQVYDNYYVYVCRKVSDSAAQTYTPYFDMTTPYPSAVGMNVLYADLRLYGDSFPSFNLNNINIFSGVSSNTAISVSQLFGYGNTVHTELPPIDLMADCSFRTVYFDPQPINEMRNTTWIDYGEATIISGEGYKANIVYNSNLSMYGKNHIDSGGPMIQIPTFSAGTVSGSTINTDTSGFKCNYLVDSTATVKPEGNRGTGDYTIANSVVNSDIYWTGYTAEHPNKFQQKLGASDYQDTNIYYTIRDHVYYTTDDNTYTDLKLASAIMSGTTAFNTRVYFTANHVATGYWYFDIWPWINPSLYAEYEPTPTADNGTLKLYVYTTNEQTTTDMNLENMNYTITAGTLYAPWSQRSISTGSRLNGYGYSITADLTGAASSLVFSGNNMRGIDSIKLTKADGTIIYNDKVTYVTGGQSWNITVTIPLT